MKVLILGASGMLGNAMLRVFSERDDIDVRGTMRSVNSSKNLSKHLVSRLIYGVDIENFDSLVSVFKQIRPQLVINCVGLVKQLSESNDPLLAIPINSLLPHRLARICDLGGARLIHISTDCVFSGNKGGYTESDHSDAQDLYGRTKYLGEVDYPNAITLRTSIIGHELQSANGLVCWFLAQEKKCKGYVNAVFSGLPTVALAKIIRDVVMPREDMTGVYHVASNPINKYELLKLISKVYGKEIEIIPDGNLIIDRSLNFQRFSKATNYVSPDWPDLVKIMFNYK